MNITPVLNLYNAPASLALDALCANLIMFSEDEMILRGTDSGHDVLCAAESHIVEETSGGEWHEVARVDPDTCGTPLADGSREWVYLCEAHKELP